MADLALRLTIFVASPNDVAEERDVVESVVEEMKEDCARQRLLLQTFRWEKQPTPGAEPPQTITNRYLRSSELTVVILGSRLGSIVEGNGKETGTLQEFRLAGESVSKGLSDNVFVYFRRSKNGGRVSNNGAGEVNAFREHLMQSNQVFFVDYESIEAFRKRIRTDLRKWIEGWYSVPSICDYAARRGVPTAVSVDQLAENRMSDASRVFNVDFADERCARLGKLAVSLYQTGANAGFTLSTADWPWIYDDRFIRTSAAAENTCSIAGQLVPVRPLLVRRESISFSHNEWFYLFCAVGLVSSLLAREVDAVARRPYPNPVHQYLKALSQAHRPEIVQVLRSWLLNDDGATTGKPIARNFAAYVLGMLVATEAQDELAQAIREDSGEDVKIYAIAALGKLRARRQLPVLVDVFNQSLPNDAQIRDMAAQAVCRTIGFLNYEL